MQITTVFELLLVGFKDGQYPEVWIMLGKQVYDKDILSLLNIIEELGCPVTLFPFSISSAMKKEL